MHLHPALLHGFFIVTIPTETARRAIPGIANLMAGWANPCGQLAKSPVNVKTEKEKGEKERLQSMFSSLMCRFRYCREVAQRLFRTRYPKCSLTSLAP